MVTVPDVLTVAQAAAHLHVSRDTIEELIRRCDLACVRIGRRVLVRTDSLAAFVEARTERAIVLKPTVRQSARSRRAGSA